jgi:hypothetical protein
MHQYNGHERPRAIDSGGWGTGNSTRVVVSGVVLAAVLIQGALAQDTTTRLSVLPAGLSLGAGLGASALRDEFISQEKYSGGLPRFGVAWSRSHGGHAFELTLGFGRSTTIRNFNATTHVTRFSLRQAVHYPLPRFQLLSRDAYAFVGPSAELFLFLNEPRVAVANPNFMQSGVALISLGLSARVIVPLGYGLQSELTTRLSVLSLGIRVVDTEEEDESPAKLLTPLSGLNASARLGVRYRLYRRLSVALSSGGHVLRISSWDPLVAVDNDLALGLTVGW